MIYGGEEPALFPVKDLYDTGMMLAYIGAMLKEYERGIAEQKEFIKEYKLFFSPSDIDTKRYYDLTVGRINSLFDFASKNGIDLFRSSQGLSLIYKVINTTDYNELARLKKSSELQLKYNDLIREMRAKGVDVLNPINTSSYDTHLNGIFNETPLQNKNIIEYWKPSLEAIKDRDHVIDDGKGHVYHLLGVTEDDVRTVVDANWDTYVNSAYGKKHMDDAKANLLLLDPSLTNDPQRLQTMAEKQIKDAVVKQGVRSKSPEADPYSLVKFKTDESIREEKNTYEYKGTKPKNRSDYDEDDIFKESYLKEDGVDYNVRDSYGLRISPIGNVGQLVYDKKNDKYYYNISGKDLGMNNNNTYRYYPTGKLKSVKTRDGSYRSYILGDVWSSKGKKVLVGKPYIVSRRDSRYGDKPSGVKK